MSLHADRPAGRVSPIAVTLGVLAVALFVGVMLTCIVSIGIWPGEAKLLGPILCTDARPDAIVVYDTYSPRPGETVTNFSLYCMGPRGDVTDHGWWKVFVLLTIFHTVLVGLVMVALAARRRLRTSRTTPAAPPPATNPLIS